MLKIGQKAPAFEYWEPVELNNEHFVLLTEMFDIENSEESANLCSTPKNR